MVKERGIPLFINIREGRIIRCIDIGREPEGIPKNIPYPFSFTLGEILYEMTQSIRLHSRISRRTDLLFIHESGKRSILRLLSVQFRHKSRISTNLIILSVSPYHRGIQTDIHRLLRRNQRQLRTHKIFLHYTVLLMENGQNLQLEGFLHFTVFHRKGTQKNIQFLSLQSFCKLSFTLLLCKMR